MPNSHNMDRDHVVMLEKLDKIILHAETEEVDTGLRKRIYALRNLLVIHSGKAQGMKDELNQLIAKNRKRILLVGAAVVSAIVVPYFVITRTTWLMQKPISCKEFPIFPTSFGRSSDEPDDFCWLSFWLWFSSSFLFMYPGL
jgi:hypothetical protein